MLAQFLTQIRNLFLSSKRFLLYCISTYAKMFVTLSVLYGKAEAGSVVDIGSIRTDHKFFSHPHEQNKKQKQKPKLSSTHARNCP